MTGQTYPAATQLLDGDTADLRRGGLRSGGYVHLRRGVWAEPGIDPLQADVRIAAVAAKLPEHAVIGGWSAARLHESSTGRDDLEVFDGALAWEDRSGPGPRLVGPDAARVVVCAERNSRLELRGDVRVFRSEARGDERISVSGIRVTSGDRTAFDLARLLPTQQAVVGVDRLLNLGVTSITGIRRVAGLSPRRRGVAAARRVVTLADPGAESPQETILRLQWVAAGLPRPRCNLVVRDREGRFAGRVDLIDPSAGVVGEYDGALHAGAARRSDDARRQELLEELGLVVVRATSVDVVADGAGAWQRRLRDAYRRAARGGIEARRWVLVGS